MARLLITGASGFIGSNLISRINLGTDFKLIPHNLLYDKKALKAAVESFQPTTIFHLAAYGNLNSQQNDEEKIVAANVIALHNLLEASKNVAYEVFLNISSSSTLLSYQTIYSATKKAGELLCLAYALRHQKNIISVLPYTVIGINEPKEHLIPTLIRSCLYGEKMRFVAEPVHDFVSVHDFISALKLISENYYLGKEVEVGTGIKTSNWEVLEIVERVTRKKANIQYVKNLRDYDNNDWVANPAILKSLGWKPLQTIEQVITKMVEYEQKNNKN